MLVFGVAHILVESTDSLPDSPAHHHRGAGDRYTLEKVAVVQSLHGDFTAGAHRARGPGPDRAGRPRAPVHSSAEYGIGVRMALQVLHLSAELPRQPGIVRIEDGHVLPAGHVAAAIAGSRNAPVSLVHDADIGGEPAQTVVVPIGRAVIDDKYLISRP